MKLFWQALADKLRADTTLVSLTQHSSSDPRIVRMPTTLSKKRGVFFVEILTYPLPGADTDAVMYTTVQFHCVGETALVASDILERVRVNFSDTTVQDAYLNISNEQVYCHQSKIDETKTIAWNEDLDVWDGVISALFVWCYK